MNSRQRVLLAALASFGLAVGLGLWLGADDELPPVEPAPPPPKEAQQLAGKPARQPAWTPDDRPQGPKPHPPTLAALDLWSGGQPITCPAHSALKGIDGLYRVGKDAWASVRAGQATATLDPTYTRGVRPLRRGDGVVALLRWRPGKQGKPRCRLEPVPTTPVPLRVVDSTGTPVARALVASCDGLERTDAEGRVTLAVSSRTPCLTVAWSADGPVWSDSVELRAGQPEATLRLAGPPQPEPWIAAWEQAQAAWRSAHPGEAIARTSPETADLQDAWQAVDDRLTERLTAVREEPGRLAEVLASR